MQVLLNVGYRDDHELASSWPMKAPMHTVATTSHGAPDQVRIGSGRAGSTSSRRHPGRDEPDAGSAIVDCSATELIYISTITVG